MEPFQISHSDLSFSLKKTRVQIDLKVQYQFFLIIQVVALDLSRNKFSSLNSLCDATDKVEFSRYLLQSIIRRASRLLVELRRTRYFQLGKQWVVRETSHLHRPLNSKQQFYRGITFNLVVLNVGENKLLGPIPTWIGTSLPNLVILSLRSNHLYGKIPPHLCHLAHIQSWTCLQMKSQGLCASVSKISHQ